jgi:hypothetical protein
MEGVPNICGLPAKVINITVASTETSSDCTIDVYSFSIGVFSLQDML